MSNFETTTSTEELITEQQALEVLTDSIGNARDLGPVWEPSSLDIADFQRRLKRKES